DPTGSGGRRRAAPAYSGVRLGATPGGTAPESAGRTPRVGVPRPRAFDPWAEALVALRWGARIRGAAASPVASARPRANRLTWVDGSAKRTKLLNDDASPESSKS